jgi:hypothetical protein
MRCSKRSQIQHELYPVFFISKFLCVLNDVFLFFLGVILRRLNFMFRRFETLCSIFVGRVNKKNNWDDIARVFIQVMVWLKRSLGQSEGEATGRVRVRIEEQVV